MRERNTKITEKSFYFLTPCVPYGVAWKMPKTVWGDHQTLHWSLSSTRIEVSRIASLYDPIHPNSLVCLAYPENILFGPTVPYIAAYLQRSPLVQNNLRSIRIRSREIFSPGEFFIFEKSLLYLYTALGRRSGSMYLSFHHRYMTDFIVHPDRGILLEGSGGKRSSSRDSASGGWSSGSGARTIARWTRRAKELRAQKIARGLSEGDSFELESLEIGLGNTWFIEELRRGRF